MSAGRGDRRKRKVRILSRQSARLQSLPKSCAEGTKFASWPNLSVIVDELYPIIESPSG